MYVICKKRKLSVSLCQRVFAFFGQLKEGTASCDLSSSGIFCRSAFVLVNRENKYGGFNADVLIAGDTNIYVGESDLQPPRVLLM